MRNQIRSRRDLNTINITFQKIQKDIEKINSTDKIVDKNEAIIVYLEKFSER